MGNSDAAGSRDPACMGECKEVVGSLAALDEEPRVETSVREGERHGIQSARDHCGYYDCYVLLCAGRVDFRPHAVVCLTPGRPPHGEGL